MESDNELTPYMVANEVFDTALRGPDGIIYGFDMDMATAIITRELAKERVQLQAKLDRAVEIIKFYTGDLPEKEAGYLLDDGGKLARQFINEINNESKTDDTK